jgi:hypothetical protein
MSLRVMETLLQSAQFKSFSGYDILDSRYNSIRDRVCSINAEYLKNFSQVYFPFITKS